MKIGVTDEDGHKRTANVTTPAELAAAIVGALGLVQLCGAFTVANPPVITAAGVGGWAVARIGAGQYRVTVPAGLDLTFLRASALGGDFAECQCLRVDATHFDVYVLNAAGAPIAEPLNSLWFNNLKVA